MADPEIEAAWRAEFKRIGETQIRDALSSGVGIADEPKRQAAFRCDPLYIVAASKDRKTEYWVAAPTDWEVR
jgi:hypothetical protein